MRHAPFTHLRFWILLLTVIHVAAGCNKRIHRNRNLSVDLHKYYSPSLKNNRAITSDSIEHLTKNKLAEIKDFEESDYSLSHKTLADRIIETAMEYLGTPHCMGGTTTRCLDCSGFVMVVYAEYGLNLPHSAHEQSKHGIHIKEKRDLVKGDLVFFHGSYNAGRYITHSGIYTGNNSFIHTSTGKGVTITSLDDSWWRGKFSFGTRILDP